MNTNQPPTITTRIQNILDSENIADKDKSESIIKLMTVFSTDFTELHFSDKNGFDEFIGKNLGPEMRAVVRKITNNSSLIHDDQLFQVISILSTMHTSAIANLIISYDLFKQMIKQRENAILEMKNHFDGMLKTFTNDIGSKLDTGIETMKSNLNTFDLRVREKQIEHANSLNGILTSAKTNTMVELSKAMSDLKSKLSDMNESSKEIVKDFKQQKLVMEQETLDKLSDEISTLFMQHTKQFFKNLKFWMIIGATCISSLATVFVSHYIR
ncbi:hypothetical protein ACO0KY_10730 [Undibacterium sp. Dicai25W]|uniref:hypothetical protein n=1 Tax=Undibacterium sp. Dicai25W TaxID=3413034 RepID=UPI003BF31152